MTGQLDELLSLPNLTLEEATERLDLSGEHMEEGLPPTSVERYEQEIYEDRGAFTR